MPEPTPDPERTTRTKPGTGKGVGKLPDLWTVPRLHLVAPNIATTHNTLRLAGWAEVRLLGGGGKPLAQEHVALFRADGVIVDGVTDDDGVVRFEDLPILPTENGTIDDVQRPAVFLPDVMEEWILAPGEPAGKFGKNKGDRDDYRKRDGTVHFLAGLFSRTEITVSTLTDEQKLRPDTAPRLISASATSATCPVTLGTGLTLIGSKRGVNCECAAGPRYV